MDEALERLVGVAYLLPIRRTRIEDCRELSAYLEWLSARVDVTVVDGSPPAVFAHHHALWGHVRHLPPAPDLYSANGKAWGVNTGLRITSEERVIIADDDVRYDDQALRRMRALLGDYDIVRPQNYFDPLPWHACWDTGRILVNRALDGDWPGTLGVRASLPRSVGGYSGDVLFENLELWRTVEAAGGRTCTARGLYVRRLPPTAAHFWSQRIRQAYDEFTRPERLMLQLALLPVALALLLARRFALLAAGLLLAVAVAEFGRRRAGEGRYFSPFASLMAPAWLVERGICAWLAVASRMCHGGVRYSGGVLNRAATPRAVLRRNLGASTAAAESRRQTSRSLSGQSCHNLARSDVGPLRISDCGEYDSGAASQRNRHGIGTDEPDAAVERER